MAGFFGLFGGKTKYVDGNENQANGKDNQDAFFLNPDEAKTLGNIEFMRKPNKIRRTFPKTKGNQVIEIIQEVSSVDKVSGQSGKTTGPVPTKVSETSLPKSESQNQTSSTRRGVDSSMDLFRNMAREIKK